MSFTTRYNVVER